MIIDSLERRLKEFKEVHSKKKRQFTFSNFKIHFKLIFGYFNLFRIINIETLRKFCVCGKIRESSYFENPLIQLFENSSENCKINKFKFKKKKLNLKFKKLFLNEL